MKYVIPGDYSEIYRDRTLFITGVGRSGTTILGKILGSMQPAYYLFEPSVVRLLLTSAYRHATDRSHFEQLLRATLFEDYILQAVHGRTANMNPSDDSYIGNYEDIGLMQSRREQLNGRREAMRLIEDTRPWFVIKIPNIQPLMNVAAQVFPGARFIHITRDGNHVIGSSMSRNWYSNSFMNDALVSWVLKREEDDGCNVPWYFGEDDALRFSDLDIAGRAAMDWRVLTNAGMEYCSANAESSIEIKYEDLVNDPKAFVDLISQRFGLSPTEITKYHVSSVKGYTLSEYPSFTENLNGAERQKFSKLMNRLGYSA